MILLEIFRVVSHFPPYISCYIAVIKQVLHPEEKKLKIVAIDQENV